MQRVAVVDYGSSNLRSVVKAIEHVADASIDVQVVSTPEALLAAEGAKPVVMVEPISALLRAFATAK